MRSYEYAQRVIAQFSPILARMEMVGYESLKADNPNFSMSETEVRALLADCRAQVSGTDECAHKFLLDAQRSRGKEYTAAEAILAKEIIMRKMNGLSFLYSPECPQAVQGREAAIQSTYANIEQALKAAIPDEPTAEEHNPACCRMM